MNINSLHFSSKHSYKLIRSGATTLDTAELLAILLGRGTKVETVLELSNRLLKNYNFHKLEAYQITEI